MSRASDIRRRHMERLCVFKNAQRLQLGLFIVLWQAIQRLAQFIGQARFIGGGIQRFRGQQLVEQNGIT